MKYQLKNLLLLVLSVFTFASCGDLSKEVEKNLTNYRIKPNH